MKNLRFLVFAFFVPLSCRQEVTSSVSKLSSPAVKQNTSHGKSNYAFDNPDTIYVLDAALGEISGLEYDFNKHQLLTHNDEQGYFFELDVNSGRIINKTKFAKNDDYEGIAIASGLTYITKHTGKIFAYNPQTKHTESYKTQFTASNDVEGLCYDNQNNRLLVACKGQPLHKKKHKDEKCIYAFDLASHTLDEEPLLTIKDAELEEWVRDKYADSSMKDLKNKINTIKNFSPSGISYTNDNSEIYIISARGSTLVIYDKEYKLTSIKFLNTKTLPQPEGICFDKANNLYISTEGQGFSGKIFKYKYHDK